MENLYFRDLKDQIDRLERQRALATSRIRQDITATNIAVAAVLLVQSIQLNFQWYCIAALIGVGVATSWQHAKISKFEESQDRRFDEGLVQTR